MLRRQYDPEGNAFEFQCRFQQRVQLSGEKLMEFVGALRFLADKAYPQWSGEQRLYISGKTSVYPGFTFLVIAVEAHAGEP